MTKRSHILLIEDNPGDVRLFREAFKEVDIHDDLVVAHDGMEAMQVLRESNGQTNRHRPDLIILDLNLPKKDGFEVLSEIKSDEALKTIPVVVLTTSKSQDDIQRTYSSHANCYIAKPADLDRFIDVIRSIDQFWLKTVRLPNV